MGARVVICRNGRVGIIVRLQFGDRPPNLCSDRQETSHNDRWTSSVITPQNCHYTLTLDCSLTPRKIKSSHRFIDPLGRCIWKGGKESPCWPGTIQSDELALLLLVETIINNRINFSDVTLS